MVCIGNNDLNNRRLTEYAERIGTGLDTQNNKFARSSRFFVHSLLSLHDYNVKLSNFTFFFSWTLMQSFRIQPPKKLPTFDELKGME